MKSSNYQSSTQEKHSPTERSQLDEEPTSTFIQSRQQLSDRHSPISYLTAEHLYTWSLRAIAVAIFSSAAFIAAIYYGIINP